MTGGLPTAIGDLIGWVPGKNDPPGDANSLGLVVGLTHGELGETVFTVVWHDMVVSLYDNEDLARHMRPL